MKFLLRTALLLAFAVLPATAQQRQTENAFSWSGKIPAGQWIRVRNLNGSITVNQGSGESVEVTATKTWRHGDPSVVRIETQKFGPNNESVVVCALWGERSSCDENSYETRGGGRSLRNNDVSVEFKVLVPRGVKVSVNTVNGALRIDGVSSEVDAGTVNGDVELSTTGGHASASSVNGAVRARLGTLDQDGRMAFSSVNGGVSVEFEGDSGADVELSTVNGALETNFEMTVSGRLDPKHLRAHVGRPGGPRLRLTTVNGNVELRRR